MVALHAGKTLHQQDKAKVSKAEKRVNVVPKIGQPYTINGVWYYPEVDPNYNQTGIASWYGNPFHGRKTANGETYDMNELSAAHKTLPMPSLVEVTNLDNGRAIVLRVNDRGPFVQGRIIDVSRRAAQLLGFLQNGVAKVRVRRVGSAKPVQTASTGVPSLPPAPKSDVSASVLKPPPGAKSAKKKNLTKTKASTRVANAPTRRPQPGDPRHDGRVLQKRAVSSVLYVQAGAFRNFQNADRLRVRLSSFGSARISRIATNGDDIFRVRVGPIVDVPRADQVLQNIINEGHSDARIVVD